MSGRYGSMPGLTNCADCPAGRYGKDAGLTSPQCSGPCVAGTFGFWPGNTDRTCNGYCQSGFYCPEGSTERALYPCPAGSYCRSGPEGLVSVRIARASLFASAFFSLPASVFLERQDGPKLCPPGQWSAELRDNCQSCPEVRFRFLGTSRHAVFYYHAHRCQREVAVPTHRFMPHRMSFVEQGFFGNVSGLTSSTCSGKCPAGHYCQWNTVTPMLCQAGTYCPEGTRNQYAPAQAIDISWFIAVPFSVTCAHVPACLCFMVAVSRHERSCPQGTFSAAGASECTLCPAGRFSNNNNPESCDQECNNGYYCPPGSRTGQARVCPAGHFCPRGAAQRVLAVSCAPSHMPQLRVWLCPRHRQGFFFFFNPCLSYSL